MPIYKQILQKLKNIEKKNRVLETKFRIVGNEHKKYCDVAELDNK